MVSDSDDDIPLSQVVKSMNNKPTPKRPRDEAADDTDSDDDVPLSQVVKKAKAAASAKPKQKKASPTKKGKTQNTKAKSKAKAAKAKKGSSTRKSTVTASASTSTGDEYWQKYYKTTKGEILQKLLCRWWYTIQWPQPGAIIEPPIHYQSLDGFPGVYVCVEGPDVGKILDKRDHSTCPSFNNLSKKSTVELAGLLEEALKGQKEALLLSAKEEKGSSASSASPNQATANGGSNVKPDAGGANANKDANGDASGTAAGGTGACPVRVQRQVKVIDEEVKWLKRVNLAKAERGALKPPRG